jgi:hypothetical protein
MDGGLGRRVGGATRPTEVDPSVSRWRGASRNASVRSAQTPYALCRPSRAPVPSWSGDSSGVASRSHGLSRRVHGAHARREAGRAPTLGRVPRLARANYWVSGCRICGGDARGISRERLPHGRIALDSSSPLWPCRPFASTTGNPSPSSGHLSLLLAILVRAPFHLIDVTVQW